MIKVMTIVGTRPEVIKLSRTINKLDKYLNHILVHTGQNYNYELNEIFFNELEIRKPDVYLDASGENVAETIGQIIIKIDKVFEQHKPDALLILGDTNSTLCSIPAKRRKIPIFHMEAGNRCFDFRVPEEINRRIVDHISDINLPYSEIARQYLIEEGLPKRQIIKTGSPMLEVLEFYKSKITSSKILDDLSLNFNKYFIFSAHREENVDSKESLSKIIEICNQLIDEYRFPIIFSTHPRTEKRLESLKIKKNKLIKFCKPFGFFDYAMLQSKALCVLSDSGTITEESSILNFPALNIREVNERPEGFEEGVVPMVGLNLKLIKQSLRLLKDQSRGNKRTINLVKDYSPNNVSDKVLRIILSYTDFVNREVWHLN